MCALTEGGPVSGFLGSLKHHREVGIQEMGDGRVHLPGVRGARTTGRSRGGTTEEESRDGKHGEIRGHLLKGVGKDLGSCQSWSLGML